MSPTPAFLDSIPRPNPAAAIETIDGHSMIATVRGKLLSFWSGSDDDDASAVAERAIFLADGTRSIRDIATCMSAEFQVEDARVQQDLIEFFLELEKAQAFELLRG